MRLCVIGLGYVGTVTAACLAELGHEVVVWDACPDRLRALKCGHSALAESGVDALFERGVESGNLQVSPLPPVAVNNLFFICVGTPLVDGHLSHEQVAEVLAEIYETSSYLGDKKIAVIRSTINIVSLEQIILELTLKMPEARVEVILNPEFLREASAVADFMAPPFIVVGGDVSEEAMEAVLTVYSQIPCRKFKVDSRTAGVLKLACNAFHATKVAFTNDLALACDLLGADAGSLRTHRWNGNWQGGPHWHHLQAGHKRSPRQPLYEVSWDATGKGHPPSALRPGFGRGGSGRGCCQTCREGWLGTAVFCARRCFGGRRGCCPGETTSGF